MIRVGALNRLPDLGPDEMIWLYPVTIDVLIAVCAPFVAYHLWKSRGFGVWSFALVFHVVALQDATVGLLFEFMIPMANQPTNTASIVALTLIAGLSAFALWLLSRKVVRAYYLQ